MTAKIEPPVLPHRLYRYRALKPRELNYNNDEVFQREIDAIKQPYLWCSDFTGMNDPMEGYYRPGSKLNKDKGYKEAIIRIYYNKIAFGIASFSDNKDNELMWTHYAGNYSGICIAYEAKSLIESLPDCVRLVRLGYGDRPPRIADVSDDPAVTILSQKKGSWSYEREWRVLGPIGKVGLLKRCITHLYLGSRMETAIRERIAAEFGHTKIKISEMRIEGYQHCWRKLPRTTPPPSEQPQRDTIDTKTT